MLYGSEPAGVSALFFANYSEVPMIVFRTARLSVRRATASETDVAFFHHIWTNPEVMKFVGYPQGLRITPDEIRAQIEKEHDTEYDVWLVVELKNSGVPVGECKLGWPNTDGISETDIKLLPQYWGNGYGTEIKRALVAYLFTNTGCRAVKATPNKENIASQRMQEAVGGRRVGEGVFRFPEKMRNFTCPVPHYVYLVYREDWEKRP
jgi:ribosomal-protein-alanine N-acetyltransferase